MTTSHETYEALLMKAVDGLLTPSEREIFQAHLEQCLECQQEYLDFQAIKQTTDGIRQRILQDAQISALQHSLPARFSRVLGFLLLLVGYLLFVGLVGHRFFVNPNVPLFQKIIAGLIATGTLTLFGQVLIHRLKTQKSDPYDKIDM